jgi:hypothetical protein
MQAFVAVLEAFAIATAVEVNVALGNAAAAARTNLDLFMIFPFIINSTSWKRILRIPLYF